MRWNRIVALTLKYIATSIKTREYQNLYSRGATNVDKNQCTYSVFAGGAVPPFFAASRDINAYCRGVPVHGEIIVSTSNWPTNFLVGDVPRGLVHCQPQHPTNVWSPCKKVCFGMQRLPHMKCCTSENGTICVGKRSSRLATCRCPVPQAVVVKCSFILLTVCCSVYCDCAI